MTRYVTLAHGDAPEIYRQSLMLLVSLVAYAPEPYELVVATDRPEHFVWFGTRVEIAYLDAALLEGWRGAAPFSMRQKLSLMRTAWPDTGAIVLLDSDVLAAPASDRPLFDRALQLYDEMAAAGIRHFATEQLVEGIVLGRTDRLRAADPWFVHYWGNKAGYDAEISRRLADAFIQGLSVKEAAARYRERPIHLPAEVRPTRVEKIARWINGEGRR